MSHFKPALRAIAQIAAALIAVAVMAALTRLALLPLLQSLLHLDEETLSYLRRVLMLVAFVLGYWGYVRWVEKRPAIELSPAMGKILLTGFGGAVLIGVPVTALYLTGTYQLVGTGGFGGMGGIALIILGAAMLEEVVFRGIAFGIVERHFGSWAALFVPTVIFSAAHIFNANWGGWLSFATGVTIGGIWTVTYMLTRNLWAVGLNHALWNYTIFATGLPLTGLQDWREQSPLRSEFSGPDWVSGGLAGPEDSVLMLVVSSLAVIVLLVIAHRRGLFKPAGGETAAAQDASA
ncbi:CPBP family intramembrane glutamic endopeptidase [uncultured Maricaulis sp.]|uniref:CPBP family intramembrane glutamic endopeptidase n=1 Tax=uncultured Maricaulis sp. TaxID=174710 RepID=UPI0030D7DE7A|tara:strand:+ start:69377 stop:70252 length:876 start_codon:yes stop_codon:yes gene_type:complete